jgi:putative cell wall-binding protein
LTLSLRRASTIAVTLVLAVSVLAAVRAPTAEASGSPVQIELDLTRHVNAERSARGIPTLRIDVRLVGPARQWSAEMGQRGGIAHHPDFASTTPPGTTRYAENVAMTSSSEDPAGALHRLFMGSESHRAVLLDGRLTDIGIGIVRTDGRTYATQRFTAGAPATTAPAVSGIADLAGHVFAGGSAEHAVITRDDVFADALTAGPLAGATGPILLTPPGPALHPEVRVALEHALPRGRTVWLIGGGSAVSEGVEQELRGAGYDVRRIGGSSRIQTAEAVAREVVARNGKPGTVMVATGWDWPDAVAGGAHGAAQGIPLLLSNVDSVPQETARAIRDFGADNVAALGGPAALADGVVHTLGASRVAGETRQGTSAKIAEHLWGYDNPAPTAWVSVSAFDDDGWTWALGAAPLAARRQAAVLLVGPDLSDELRGYLTDLGYGNGREAELLTVGPVPSQAADEVRSLLR